MPSPPPFPRREPGSSRFPPRPDPIPTVSWKIVGIPEPRGGSGFPGGPGACRMLGTNGEREFPPSLQRNPHLGLKILQFNKRPRRLRRKSPPFLQDPDADLHVCRRKKAQGEQARS